MEPKPLRMDRLQGMKPTYTQTARARRRSSRGLSESCAIQLSKSVLSPSLFPAEKADGESSLGQMGKSNKNFGGAVPCSDGSMGGLPRSCQPPILAEQPIESRTVSRGSRGL